jgi:DNA-binding PadR family transcriptional regulator
MNISKQLPLTETTYLILLALKNPGHGYEVMQRVEDMSQSRVRIAAGTMYGALDNLSKQKLIKPVESDDPRRKVFQTTDQGLDLLRQETIRMEKQIALYHSVMEEHKNEKI